MEKESLQGKAESVRWKREATLKDILDLLDEINNSNKTPEEKAKLTQRVIDYGQHLSEEIYFGKRPIPEDKDMSVKERNEIRKKFNIRMYSTYYTKGESSYEEAQRPTGYFDKHRSFVKDPYTGENPGTRNHKNPRWHPLPLEQESVMPPIPQRTEGNGGTTGPGVIIPPITDNGKSSRNTADTNGIENTPANKQQNKSDREKRKRKAAGLIPLLVPVAISLLMLSKDGKTQQTQEPQDNQTVPEATVTPLTPEEQDYMRYTVEKGQRMAAKQFGVSLEEGAEIYNQFVENIKSGNLPEVMLKMTESYQMAKMVNADLNLNFQNSPEIAATTWLLMSTSYDAIRPVVHEGIINPTEEITPANAVRLKKSLDLAKNAAQKHDVNEESNLVSDVDYGLYGATKKTGWAISLRKAQDGNIDKSDLNTYKTIADNALQNGHGY